MARRSIPFAPWVLRGPLGCVIRLGLGSTKGYERGTEDLGLRQISEVASGPGLILTFDLATVFLTGVFAALPSVTLLASSSVFLFSNLS
jgi:hypothetical protein